jgi:hypothetical protein
MVNQAMVGPGFESWLTSPGQEKKRGKMPEETLTHMPNQSKAACRYDVMQPENASRPDPPREEKV